MLTPRRCFLQSTVSTNFQRSSSFPKKTNKVKSIITGELSTYDLIVYLSEKCYTDKDLLWVGNLKEKWWHWRLRIRHTTSMSKRTNSVAIAIIITINHYYYHLITLSPYHLITLSPYQLITLSPITITYHHHHHQSPSPITITNHQSSSPITIRLCWLWV